MTRASALARLARRCQAGSPGVLVARTATNGRRAPPLEGAEQGHSKAALRAAGAEVPKALARGAEPRAG